MVSSREWFFERLAQGLNDAYCVEDTPRCFHLDCAQLPESERLALAAALCRIQVPGTEVSRLPVIDLDEECGRASLEAAVGAVIVNAVGKTYSEIESCIDSSQRKPSKIVSVNGKENHGEWSILRYDFRIQSDIVASALDDLFRRADLAVPTLARVRFENAGYNGLLGFLTQEDLPTGSTNYELFYHRLTKTWKFNGSDLTSAHIKAWVDQFAKDGFEEEAHSLLRHLHQWGFTTEDAVIERLIKTYSESVSQFSAGRSVRCIAIQEVGKSEGKLAYRLKPRVKQFETLRDVVEEVHGTGVASDFYCFDDFIGSGDSIVECLFERESDHIGRKLQALLQAGKGRVFVIAHDVSELGMHDVETDPRAHSNVRVLGYRPLGNRDRVFSAESRVIGDVERRKAFKAYCAQAGEILFPGHGLGWRNGQLCICYDYTIPDNSLPVLWGRSGPPKTWEPLFERNR